MIDAPHAPEALPAPSQRPSSPRPPAGLPIRKELERFIQHINSLEATLPWSMLAINAAGNHAKERYDKFVGDHCTIEKRGEQDVLRFDPSLRERYNKIRRRRENVALAGRLVPRSFIVSLVSQYDAFLGGLIRVYFGIKPDALNASEKSLNLAQLLEFGSVDSAKEYIIEKEVESVLRKSHAEQFDWMEQRFEVPLRKDLPVWKTFIELTERRNLFVHTNGVVSSQYLSVCRKHGVDCDDVKPGAELHVTPEYFTTAYEAIFEIALKLAHVFWRKMLPDDRRAADSNLQRVGYELLVDRQFRLAATLMDFAVLTLKKHSSEQMRRMMVINRAQAYKWLGDQSTCLRIVNAEDWSASSDDFRVAVAVLTDRPDDVVAWMKRLGEGNTLDRAAYREWPLFRELRKDPDFVAAFEEVFGEPLAIAPRLEPITDSPQGADSSEPGPGSPTGDANDRPGV